MANARSNGPHGNGGEAPGWARELSADVRAALREAGEDRKRHTREMARAIAGATRVGMLIRHDIEFLHQDNRRLLEAMREGNQHILGAIHELTGSIEKLVRVFISGRNGRGGNGRRFKA